MPSIEEVFMSHTFKFLTLFTFITWAQFGQAQFGSGATINTAPVGSGSVLTPTSSVNQPSGGSGQATTSDDVTPPLTGTDPAGLNTATGTDLTPTQGQQSQLPSGSVTSPLPGRESIIFPETERQAEELDFSTLPSESEKN
jgi:hypothetical protein